MFDEVGTHIAWTDYTGCGPRSQGRPSRLHRRDTTLPSHERYAACGIAIPMFSRRIEYARVFEATAAESTGYCLRCFPYACSVCRRRRSVGVCCSSHSRRLCHSCYRVSHFVEVCSPTCEHCITEGLPVIFPPRPLRPVETLPDIATVGS